MYLSIRPLAFIAFCTLVGKEKYNSFHLFPTYARSLLQQHKPADLSPQYEIEPLTNSLRTYFLHQATGNSASSSCILAQRSIWKNKFNNSNNCQYYLRNRRFLVRIWWILKEMLLIAIFEIISTQTARNSVMYFL